MRHLVVDTSVVVKWFLIEEELADHAKSLLRSSLEGHAILHIPLLAYIEFGNVLKTQKSITHDQKVRYLSELFELQLGILQYGSPHALQALRLAEEFDLVYYDAVFVALAQAASYDFITADQKLHRKLHDLPFVRSLAEIDVAL